MTTEVDPRTSARGRGHLAFWTIPGAVLFTLAYTSGRFLTTEFGIAVWWPAAGVGVWWVLRATRRRRIAVLTLVFALTVSAGVLAGRPPFVTLVYSTLAVFEAGAFAALLPQPFRLRTNKDAARFIVVTIAVALVFGVVVAASIVALGDVEVVATATIIAASHASAVLLIAPFAVLPARDGRRAGVLESLVQVILVAGAIVLAFRPGASLPLGFLVFAVLVWATLRFSPGLAYLESLLVSLSVLVLTVLGYGSFAESGLPPAGLAVTTATFLFTVGGFTVTVVTAAHEHESAARALVQSADVTAAADRAKSRALLQQYELDRQREDLVATVSHELRTPVTSIAGYALLLAEQNLPGTPHTWVDAIARNSSRLSMILDDILSISPQGALGAPAPSTLSVADLMTDALTVHRSAAQARQIVFAVDAPDAATVFADRKDALRALRNLVSNAVKFAPPATTVTITAVPSEAHIAITLSNSGPALAPEALARAFDPFYRDAEATAMSAAGTGLGLPIARLLAQRNGGDITLTSTPGRGVSATLTLPSTAPKSAPRPLTPEGT